MACMVDGLRNIYYLCPSPSYPAGGIQKIYQHVDALNASGFKAYVLHDKPGYRYGWRANHTHLAYFKPRLSLSTAGKYCKRYLRAGINAVRARNHPRRHLECSWSILGQNPQLFTTEANQQNTSLPDLDTRDVLVVPDYLSISLYPHLQHLSLVVLHFTGYFTFQSVSLQDAITGSFSHPYDSHLMGCIVGSQDTENYLRMTFPHLAIYRCQFGVDTDQFVQRLEKQKTITFMPRRLRGHLVQVISILKLRNRLKDRTFVPLENMTQSELIKQLQSSALFLSTSYEEGFGLPPAEALSCGTLVVGYDGEAGKEFLLPPFAQTVAHGNIIDFVNRVESMASLFDSHPGRFRQLGQEASDFIKDRYSTLKECESVVKTWTQIQDKLHVRLQERR